ncbi:flagellar hook-length control protein FliK [Phyllobacterium sp. K27]
MTIGANMAFKLKLQSPVRAAGKEETPGDLREMSGTKEPQTDFGSLLQAVKPKQKGDPKHSPGDEKSTVPESPPDHKNEGSMPIAQSTFMQPVIKLEQMLDRRLHDETGSVPDGLIDNPALQEKTSVTASGHLGLTVGDNDIERQIDAEGVPAKNKQEPEQAAERPARPSNSSASPVPGQTASGPVPQAPVVTEQQKIEAVGPAFSSNEVKLEKRVSEPVAKSWQDVFEAPDKSTFQQAAPSLPQAMAKPFAGSIAMVAAPANQPAVADIQIISDRTTGAARTLVIQLQPVELGSVTARLRLTSDGMHIQIAVANAAMAEHLSNDREALGKALHRAGVTEDASNVTISIVDRSSAGAGSPQPGQQNLNGQDPQQLGARADSQGQSGFQNMPEDRSFHQNGFGESAPDDHAETLARPGTQMNSSRGLVV